MTISSSTRKAGPFTGNGTTTAFPFTFKVFTTADLLVVLANTSTGVETTQALTTNYTVSLNSDQNANPGGTVTMLVAPAAGYTLTLTSQVAQTQAVDLTNAGGFYPSVINLAFDKLTILIQQMQTYLTGALKLPLSASGVSATLPTPSGGKILGWAGDGLSIVNLTPTTSSIAVPQTSTTGSAILPSGTTLQRDSSAGVGYFRWNTNLSQAEAYNGSSWVQFIQGSGGALTVAQGGTGAATLTGVLKGNGTSAFTAATAGTDYVAPGTATTFTAQQTPSNGTLTDQATITWDGNSNGQVATVTLGGSRTLGAPTNVTANNLYVLTVVQDGTGSRTLAWNSSYKFAGGTAPTLSTAASAVDVFTFIGASGNVMRCIGQAQAVA